MQVSLLHEHGLRDHSISSHSATRRVALSRYPEGHGCHARASNLGRFEVFTPGSMGGQTSPFASRLIEHAKPNRVRRPLQRTFYGLVRHLLLLSTSPHGDAVAVGYRSENEYLGRTYTSLTVCAHKRTGASCVSMARPPEWRSDRFALPLNGRSSLRAFRHASPLPYDQQRPTLPARTHTPRPRPE